MSEQIVHTHANMVHIDAMTVLLFVCSVVVGLSSRNLPPVGKHRQQLHFSKMKMRSAQTKSWGKMQ